MAIFHVPTKGVACWQACLADPEKHWRSGFSARSLAYDWEESRGLPPAIAEALEAALGAIPEVLLAIPEHKVSLPGGTRDSQNDLFVLLGIDSATAAMTVEAKVDETFDLTLSEWKPMSSPGKTERFLAITSLLGLSFDLDDSLRYQLFHRTASAVIEAKRFRCQKAVMLVQSYSLESRWFADFAAFAALFGIKAIKNRLASALLPDGMPLYLGWVSGNPAMLSR